MTFKLSWKVDVKIKRKVQKKTVTETKVRSAYFITREAAEKAMVAGLGTKEMKDCYDYEIVECALPSKT